MDFQTSVFRRSIFRITNTFVGFLLAICTVFASFSSSSEDAALRARESTSVGTDSVAQFLAMPMTQADYAIGRLKVEAHEFSQAFQGTTDLMDGLETTYGFTFSSDVGYDEEDRLVIRIDLGGVRAITRPPRDICGALLDFVEPMVILGTGGTDVQTSYMATQFGLSTANDRPAIAHRAAARLLDGTDLAVIYLVQETERTYLCRRPVTSEDMSFEEL